MIKSPSESLTECLPVGSGNFIIGWIGFVFFFVASTVEICFIIYKAFFSADGKCDDKCDEKRASKKNNKNSIAIH